MGTGIVTWRVPSNPVFSRNSEELSTSSFIKVFITHPLKRNDAFLAQTKRVYQNTKIPQQCGALQISFTDSFYISEIFSWLHRAVHIHQVELQMSWISVWNWPLDQYASIYTHPKMSLDCSQHFYSVVDCPWHIQTDPPDVLDPEKNLGRFGPAFAFHCI